MSEISPPNKPVLSNREPPTDADRKRTIVFLLLACSLLLGPVIVFLPEKESMLDFLVSIPLLVLAVTWCHIDARAHDYRIGCLFRFLLILLFVIAFPVYIFRTRGLNGAKTLFWAFILVLLMFMCMVLTGLATLFAVDFLYPGYADELLGMEG